MLYSPRKPVAAQGVAVALVESNLESPCVEDVEYFLFLRFTHLISSNIGSYTKSLHSWHRMKPLADSTAAFRVSSGQQVIV